ncbi:cutinase-domain-containing protein [Microthyrium microscopicum]|uniref:Cutinase n=1 Tax=Microthyrium microscopicum TaxID=703497 RepID=A0A6A6UF41_9PEZI|nr:cutinase-domain-containing protein [Microthyrium microscopicum]
MRYTLLAALAGVATAHPMALPQEKETIGTPPANNLLGTIAKLTNSKGELDGGWGPKVRNEIIESTPCGKVTFIFARASKEPANMGGSVGPIICNGLKKAYGQAAVNCQGVGGAYTAGILDNISAKGTSATAVREATSMFTKAVEKCPNSQIVFGGFSQGTAVMHGTVGALPANIKAKIVGGALFGDTRNTQDKSQVPNFPKEKVHVYCDKSDGVCWGTLNVTNGHFVYATDGSAEQGLAFLKGKIDAAKGGAAAEKKRSIDAMI